MVFHGNPRRYARWKPLLFKVGSHRLAQPTQRTLAKKRDHLKRSKSFVGAFSFAAKSSAAAAGDDDDGHEREGKDADSDEKNLRATVSFETDPHAMHTMLNLSNMVDITESAYGHPDDFERAMTSLGAGGVSKLNRDVSTAFFAAAYEDRSGGGGGDGSLQQPAQVLMREEALAAVEAYACGERERLRRLPDTAVATAFEIATSGSARMDVMCELLASRHRDLGSLSFHLMRAASRGRIAAMVLLLDFGADPAQEIYGSTSLCSAAEHGQEDAASVILSIAEHQKAIGRRSTSRSRQRRDRRRRKNRRKSEAKATWRRARATRRMEKRRRTRRHGSERRQQEAEAQERRQVRRLCQREGEQCC